MFVLMIASVVALDLSASKWNARGTVGLDSVDNFFGEDITFAKGRYNAHVNLQRGVSGSGQIYARVKTVDGSKERLSVRWTSRSTRSCAGSSWRNRQCGAYGGMEVLEDTLEKTVMQVNARTIHYERQPKQRSSLDISFGVPVTVTYMKSTGEFIVESNNGDFRFSA